MTLKPIELDESKNAHYRIYPECVPILDVYIDYYTKIGYKSPWIGYFALDENQKPVGACGFKGQPVDGKIEIAYGTFAAHEGKGIGTSMCKELIEIALKNDPLVIISARTLPINSASVSILVKNGFENQGIIWDQDDGEVFEWIFRKHTS